MEQTISRTSRECWEAFHHTMDVLGQSLGYEQQYLDLSDEFEVFRAWARTSGACSEDHASLDYRLRENTVTWRLFISILEGLLLCLSRCVSLLKPENSPTRVSASALGEASTSMTLPRSSDSESSSDGSGSIPTVGDFLQDVSSSVDKLVQMARAIRNPSAQSNSKAEAYEEWEDTPTGRISKSKGFEDFVRVLLEHRYRGLHENVRNRIGSALSRCNRRIAYQKRHQPRLRHDIPGVVHDTPKLSGPTTIPAAVPAQISPSGSSSPTVPFQHTNHPQIAPSLGDTKVSASTVSPKYSPLVYDDRSSAPGGSSASRMMENPTDELPPPPTLEGPARYFECPYCCVQLPRNMAKRRAWTNHVISDLQPYVCIFEECSMSDQSFRNEGDWLEHERWHHNVFWSCNGFNTHSPLTFRDRGEFRAHFETYHPGVFSYSDINKHLEVSAMPANELFNGCPFCDFATFNTESSERQGMITEGKYGYDLQVERQTSQQRIKRHILDHLLSLFQLVLQSESNVPDLALLGSSCKTDVQSNVDPNDEGLDLIDAHYMDPEFASPLLYQDESIPTALEDEAPFIQSMEYASIATDPLLESFVRNAMIVRDIKQVTSIESLALGATRILIDLVVMVLDGLGGLEKLGDQQERLRSELQDLHLTLMSLQGDGSHIDAFTAFLVPAHVSESESSFAILHETLWASAYKLDLVSSKDSLGRTLDMVDLEGIISTLQTHRPNLTRALKGGANVVVSDCPTELQDQIQLRPGMKSVQLDLSHPGREIIYRGDLFIGISEYKWKYKWEYKWEEHHAILFDHYMVLAKTLSERDAKTNSINVKYNVTELPIPMALLVLEGANKHPIPNGTLIGSTTSGLIWPFHVRHLGQRNVFTLGVSTSEDRREWCAKITDARTMHAISLRKQKAEPFRLRVIANRAFASDAKPHSAPSYDILSENVQSEIIRGTPLSRAMEELEEEYTGGVVQSSPVCVAGVNCATSFNLPNDGCPVVVVGTGHGVYISDYNDPRTWRRIITISHVTQIAVLEEFSLILLISDSSLLAYDLDTTCSSITVNPSIRNAPQKLSDAPVVDFFAIGRMKVRTLVFYKERIRHSSTFFTVLEPIVQNLSAATQSIPNSSTTKPPSKGSFRGYDYFRIDGDAYALNAFGSSFAISTARGIVVMNLEQKMPHFVPDLRAPDSVTIAARIRNLRPLGMFRLSDAEFLLVFSEVALYVNKHGDISRKGIIEFLASANQACLLNSIHLALIDAEGSFVEIRNAINGCLEQVIAGKNIRLLDGGTSSAKGSVMIRMQHPEYKSAQLVLELVSDPEFNKSSKDTEDKGYEPTLTSYPTKKYFSEEEQDPTGPGTPKEQMIRFLSHAGILE